MILPGFSPKAPSLPAIAAPAPPPRRDDPAIAEAKKKQRLSDLRRRGRASTIIAPREDQLGNAPVDRPQARSAQVLGQIAA